MGLVISISHGNLRITAITAENTAVFYSGNFTEKSPEYYSSVSIPTSG